MQDGPVPGPVVVAFVGTADVGLFVVLVGVVLSGVTDVGLFVGLVGVDLSGVTADVGLFVGLVGVDLSGVTEAAVVTSPSPPIRSIEFNYMAHIQHLTHRQFTQQML